MPPPITWTNAASIASVIRQQGVTVTWTGGDPNGFVYVTGYSGAMLHLHSASGVGTFTVPPLVTNALCGVRVQRPHTDGRLAGLIHRSSLDIGSAASLQVSQPVPFQ